MKKNTISKLLALLLVLAMAIPCLPVVVSANGVESFTEQLEKYDSRTEFVINTKEDLKAFMNSEKNYAGKKVLLGADIVWNDATVDYTNGTFIMKDGSTPENWIPYEVAMFGNGSDTAIFDGQGHTISGIYISTNKTSYSGFFTRISKATIKNVIFNNAFFTNTSTSTSAKQMGFITGVAYGDNTFSNVHVNAYQCHSTTATNPAIGGICGYLYSKATTKFNSCTVSGIVSAPSAATVGGFVGFGQYFETKLEMTDCVNYAVVNGTNYVAGLAGRLKGDAHFTRCASLGAISSTNSYRASLTTMFNSDADHTPYVTFTDCIHSTKSSDHAAMVFYNKDTSYTNVIVKVNNNTEVNYTGSKLGSSGIAKDITNKMASFTAGTDDAINVYGVQQNADKDQARFIATLKTNESQNENNIKSLGFDISVLGKNNNVVKNAPAVYKSIKATTASGSIVDIKAGEGSFNSIDYLATCIIPDVPTNAESVTTLVVSAFITTINGTRVDSKTGALILTISGGNIVGIAHTI